MSPAQRFVAAYEQRMARDRQQACRARERDRQRQREAGARLRDLRRRQEALDKAKRGARLRAVQALVGFSRQHRGVLDADLSRALELMLERLGREEK